MKQDHRPAERFPLRGGVLYALGAAALFGASTPFAKLLVGDLSPVLLAGLLYLGSGTGLSIIYLARRRRVQDAAPLSRADWPWLAGAILFGGIVAPILLLTGLAATPGATASLLLNLEGVFTALLAWFAFRENFDRRIAVGMALIVTGGVVLAWPEGGSGLGLPLASLAVAGACLCWGIDNNLTQKVSAADPLLVAAVKGIVAGGVNLLIARLAGATLPPLRLALGAAVVGLLGYGFSLSLFVLGLRHLGTARTGAYFSLAPFIGAAVAVPLLGEPPTIPLFVAACLMGSGGLLHLTEVHRHEHRHSLLEHAHSHVHDEHHRHTHEATIEAGESHEHRHVHQPIVHSHGHYPDIHHRHDHS
ncbi:MAG: EamA family transporter [Myxococcales bacterium]|nr:EamA family transporter [Myxococcales bacterium]